MLASARAAWDNRQTVEDLPLFGAFWDRDAELPTAGTKDAEFVEGAVNSSAIPERDLSVQLSGWMLMEAAHTVAGDGSDTAGDGSDTAGDGSDTAGDGSDIMDGGDAVQ